MRPSAPPTCAGCTRASSTASNARASGSSRPAWLGELRASLEARIAAADPLDPGVEPPSEPWARDVVPLLGFERRGSRLHLPGAAPGLGPRQAEAAELERQLDEAGPAATKVEDADLARYLEQAGRLVRLGDGYAVGAGAYAAALELVRSECEAAGRITLARFRDLAGVGRRDAQLLLERMDADGVTKRVGERAAAQAQVVCDTLERRACAEPGPAVLRAGEAVRDVVRRGDRDRPQAAVVAAAGR